MRVIFTWIVVLSAGPLLLAEDDLEKMSAKELRTLVAKLRAENAELKSKLNEKASKKAPEESEEDRAEKKAKYVAAIEAHYAYRTDFLKRKLLDAQKERRELSKKKMSADQKKARSDVLTKSVRDLGKQLADHRKSKPSEFPPLYLSELAVGKFGNPELTSGGLRIVQIIDEDTMLVRWYETRLRKVPLRQTFTLKSYKVEKWIWINGVSTDGLVSDKHYEPSQPFEITGTRTYDTASGGSKTVFVAEAIDLTILGE